MNKKLNLDNPRSYNEKLQWLKLNDRNPLYTIMVDKYEVKEYISKTIGKEFVIPTIGIYDKFDDIDFDKLPNQFVIKCTHDSGGNIICKNKEDFDISAARIKINKALNRNYFFKGREWPYKNVKPRILIEEYMEDEEDKELRDYKIFTFNSKAKIIFISSGRSMDKTVVNYYDKDFNFLDFTWGYPHSEKKLSKPKNYELMFELSEKLAKNTYTLRVDWYEVNGKLYFGELTFYDGSGLDKIVPTEWDDKLGSWINLDANEISNE